MADDGKEIVPEPMPEGEESPPPGVKAMAFVRWAILVIMSLLAVLMWLSHARTQLSDRSTDTSAGAPKYHCPMHPQIVSDEPGECPICHMTLEPISASRGGATGIPEAAPAPPSDAGSTQGGAFWCPMHPEVHSHAAGRCPTCKMALEPVPATTGDGASNEEHAMHVDGGGPAPGTTPPGTTTIDLALDRVQAIGVRTAVAEERYAGRTLRVTAIVMPPEQGSTEVHVRSAGFVEAIHVDQTGVRVRAGQPMLSVYSPEILQAQNELLATRGWGADGGATSSSARRKLALLGMASADIERVVAKGEPLRAITITTPGGGFVTKKNVVLGSYVTPETTLYEVQDLSKVYVVADVFLPDVPFANVGSDARFVPAGHPEKARAGRVDLIYPALNAEARTRRIRMQLENPGSTTYAPGEYGTVELTTAPRKRVSIPRDALVDTGTATYVFVAPGEGRYVPRMVAVGRSDDDQVIVESGLVPGERVVSGATFLIDSESRLRASIAEAASAPAPAGATPGQGPSCSTDFDRAKYPGKFAECVKCETVHRGMGTMEADCKNVIARPWK